MASSLRVYESYQFSVSRTRASDLHVGAFVGPDGDRSVQLTMDNDYACLTEAQVVDLIETLVRRLAGRPGYEATGWSDEERIRPDGSKVPNASTEASS